MAVALFLTLHCVAEPPPSPGRPQARVLGEYRGLGLVDSHLILSDKTGNPSVILQGFTYDRGGFDVVAVDLRSGKSTVLQSPTPGEAGVKGIVKAPDGKVYFGTYPQGHILMWEPGTFNLVDLGRPCPGDPSLWIWNLVVAPDGWIYGATSPRAKLIRFSPQTRQMQDLGRMDTENVAGHDLIALPDGMLYMAMGYSHPQVVAFDTRTGQHHLVLPRNLPSTASAATLSHDPSGPLFANAAGVRYLIEGLSARAVGRSHPKSAAKPNIWSDQLGRIWTGVPQSPTVQNSPSPSSGEQMMLRGDYTGKPRGVFRLANGGDGSLYASTAYPSHLFRMSPKTGHSEFLALAGLGEAYQMIDIPKGIVVATYGAFGGGHLLDYRFDKPVRYEYDLGASRWVSPITERNPQSISIQGVPPNWRPKGMVKFPDGNLFVGGMPGYAQRGGTLVRFNPLTGSIATFQVSHDQSIVSLCVAGRNLLIGTSLEGGTGIAQLSGSARLLLWDPGTHTTLQEWVPVPGANQINDLVSVSPTQVVGVAGGRDVFLLDLDRGDSRILGSLEGVCRAPGIDLYNCAGTGLDGNIYGLVDKGIFRVDTKSWKVGMYCRESEIITAGFAILDNKLYYAAGVRVKWVQLP